jgi:ATP-dependent DNA helicase RecG
MQIRDESPAKAAALVEALIARSESHFLELKRVSGKMVGKALETVCAFANAEGGMLVLGVADIKEYRGSSRLFGIEENLEAVDELSRKLLTEFHPSLASISLHRLSCTLGNGGRKGEAGHLLLVRVESSGLFIRS